MKVWQFIKKQFQKRSSVVLLYVLQSKGSSPGRQGFKMAVSQDGEICGTIGGGIMEHKLVEKAKKALQKGDKTIELIPQFHDKEQTANRSGMICSGSQHIVFMPLFLKYKKTIERILASLISEEGGLLEISKEGLFFFPQAKLGGNLKLSPNFVEFPNWRYQELIGHKPTIHIIGGGHVGLALSEIMSFLGFYVKSYDHREGLNTMEENHFANEKHILNFDQIGTAIPENEQDYIALMTFGYRTDKQVLKQLLHKKYRYIGMMGSDAKTAILMEELKQEGYDSRVLDAIFAPIGIPILSKTAKEIAVSIAAEIIKVKNHGLPTGRSFGE